MALQNGARIPRPPVHRITLGQLAVLVPLCLAMLAFSKTAASSVLCGGLVAVIPQAYFATVVFRRPGVRSARETARSGYIGEVGKFMLSITGFAVVFATVRPIDGLAVFGGYVLMLALQILGSWWLLREPPAPMDKRKSVD